MGNACCNQSKDDFNKDYNKGTKKMDPALNDLLKECSKNEDKIVKI